MKTRYSITAMPAANWLRYSIIPLIGLLSIALVSIVLPATPYRVLTSVSVTAPVTAVQPALDQHERHPNTFPVDIYTPLDQHERHADLLAPKAENAAALDQHERHPSLLASVAAQPALDQHERHASLFPLAAQAALDQHERHPDLFVR